MAEPLTREQYQKALDDGFSHDDIVSFERQRLAAPAGPEARPMVRGFFGDVPADAYARGERNVMGNIFERPGAAVRSFLSGQGYAAGAINPGDVPTFQESLLDRYYRSFGEKIPTRLERFIGNVPSTLGLAADISTNPADVLTLAAPKVPGVRQAFNALMRSRLGRTASSAANAPISKIPQVIQEGMRALNPEGIFQATQQGISQVVKKGISKGVRPTVTGKGTAQRTGEYWRRVQQGVVEIVKNQDNLGFVDELGTPVSRLPKNLPEYAQAIERTKAKVYQTYATLSQQAGDVGARFSAKGIVSKLEEVSKDLKFAPETRKYAGGLRGAIRELDGATPDVVQTRIEDLNQSLKGFYFGRVEKAKAEVDASVAKLMRSELDNIIERATGQQYQYWKNVYGALTTVEKEVNHRAMVALRASPRGLFDLTDIFSGGQVLSGIFYGNPASVLAGATQYAIKSGIKSINNPNRIVTKMFQDVSSLLQRQQAMGSSGVAPRMPSRLGRFNPLEAVSQVRGARALQELRGIQSE